MRSLTLLTRRSLIAAAWLGLDAKVAWSHDLLSYRGWTFGSRDSLPEDVSRSLQAQADIVESIDLKPEIKTFFKTLPLEVDPTTSGGAGAYSFKAHRMFLSMDIDPPQNPVLLHELLHAYHDQRLPQGTRNPKVISFYDRAKASGAFPAQSYMFKNSNEFFAMCASVVLWGRAARPPSTREKVRQALPEMYAWVVEEFTSTGVLPEAS